jgi:hypothetical protein
MALQHMQSRIIFNYLDTLLVKSRQLINFKFKNLIPIQFVIFEVKTNKTRFNG